MFGIGMPEMLVILAVALIVIGPKKLPDLAKSLGRALGEFKRATSDLKESIQRDTGLDDVRDSLNEVNTDVRRALTLNDASAADTNPPEGPEDPSTDLPDSLADSPADSPAVKSSDAQPSSDQRSKPRDTSVDG